MSIVQESTAQKGMYDGTKKDKRCDQIEGRVAYTMFKNVKDSFEV